MQEICIVPTLFLCFILNSSLSQVFRLQTTMQTCITDKNCFVIVDLFLYSHFKAILFSFVLKRMECLSLVRQFWSMQYELNKMFFVNSIKKRDSNDSIKFYKFYFTINFGLIF